MTHMGWVLLAMFGIPAVYIIIDIFLALNDREGDTYSAIIRNEHKKSALVAPGIALAMGVLCGHWFIEASAISVHTVMQSTAALALMAIITGICDKTMHRIGMMFSAFSIGILGGGYFW